MARSESDADPRETGADPAAICTLPADGLDARLAWIRREIMPHARGSERLDDGIALELGESEGLVERVDQLIALESECCGGLRFERTRGAKGGVRLEVRGIDPDAAILRSLASAVSPGSR